MLIAGKPPWEAPYCPAHDYEIPREIARDASKQALKIGYLRYKAMWPPPHRYLSNKWDYAYTYSEYRDRFNNILEQRWEKFSENWDEAVAFFHSAYHSVTAWCVHEYNRCLSDHCNNALWKMQRAKIHYQRALIYFDQGDTCAALKDMYAVMNIGASSPEMQLTLGQAYNEANQFIQAIKILTELINKEPKNKEAYLERAHAYFERGDFSKSMDDYIASSMRPTLISHNPKSKHLKFSLGIGKGVLKGGMHSVVDFAPSLLSTFQG